MKYSTYVLVLFFSCTTAIQAQTIQGKIIDKITQRAIPDVLVREELSRQSTLSNSSGIFSLTIKPGQKISLNFYHLRYENQKLTFYAPAGDTAIVVTVLEKIRAINDVEVAASPIKHALTKSYSVAIIDEQVIEEKIATSLIDVLEEVPGITKRGEYHSPIALRGLGGKRLLITKDGNRRMGNFPKGFMGQDVNVYDLAKVEVIKGPASVRYGPGAITGIINLVSKAPFTTPGLYGKGAISYATNNGEKSVLLGLNYAGFDHAFSLSCRLRDADNFKYGDGNTAVNSYYRDKDIRLSYTWENSYFFALNAESELHLGGPWGRPAGFNGEPLMRVYNRDDNTWHNSITAKYKPYKQLRQAELSLYYDLQQRQQIKDSYDKGTGRHSYRKDVNYRNYYTGWRALAVFDPRKNLELSIGSDGVYYRVESPTILNDFGYTVSDTAEAIIRNKVSKNAGVSLAGIFTETEFKTDNERLKVRAGLRFDYSHINEGEIHDTLLIKGREGHVFTWNSTVGAVYSLSPNLFLSFQTARSSRMPDATEMFILTSGSDGDNYGNPDLAPEHGLNFDAGFRGNPGVFNFDFSLFANFLHDFISLEYDPTRKPGMNYTYENIDRARIFGSELSVGGRWHGVFHPDNSITYSGSFVYTRGDDLTHSSDFFGKGTPLRRIPPFHTYHRLTFRRMVNTSVSLYAGTDFRHYTEQKRIAPSAEGGYISPRYRLLGASAGVVYHRQSTKWDLKIKCNNLTNNIYRNFETRIYGMARNFRVMLTVMF